MPLIKNITPIPPGRQFVCPPLDKIKEGQVLLDGEFGGLAFGGSLVPGMGVEYILTDDGIAVWHNEYFRGLSAGRWRLIKRDGKLLFERIVPWWIRLLRTLMFWK